MTVEEILEFRDFHARVDPRNSIEASEKSDSLSVADTALALYEKIGNLQKERDLLISNNEVLRAENEGLSQTLGNESSNSECLSIDIKELKAENERLRKLDDPKFDATDAAHPAWWRGEKYGSQQAARKIREISDGGDDGVGVSSDPDWEKIRRDILALKVENERLRKDVMLSPSEYCHRHSVQNCHACENADCGDNTTPSIARLKVENSRLARYEMAWKQLRKSSIDGITWAILNEIAFDCGIKEDL